MNKKLKPCPFCGNKVEIKSGDAELEQVICPICGAHTLWKVNAGEIWNKRTRKETRLKPCPICGSQGKVRESYDGKYVAQCSSCGLTAKQVDYPEDAISAWNARPYIEN